MRNLASWASGIRTREYSSQSAVPYLLAIAHQPRRTIKTGEVVIYKFM